MGVLKQSPRETFKNEESLAAAAGALAEAQLGRRATQDPTEVGAPPTLDDDDEEDDAMERAIEEENRRMRSAQLESAGPPPAGDVDETTATAQGSSELGV